MKKYLFLFMVLIMALCASVVSADDLSDVKQDGVLRLGVAPDYIPFVFYDESGDLTGIDVALIQEVGRRMGVQVQVLDYAFDGMIDALNLGQVDIIGTAFAKTDERAAVIDLSRVYYNNDSQFIGLASMNVPANVDLSSFRDLKIGVMKGTSFDQWIKTNMVGAGYVSTKNVYLYSTTADGMRALDRKDIDLFIMSQDIYEDAYQGTGKYQIFWDGFLKENFVFGMRKNSTLTSVVNQHLTDMIKDGTAQSIANRFFSMNFNEATSTISRSSQIATPTPNVPVYVVPTAIPQTNCVNSMTFVSDVTITDGHQVNPGESFNKTWRVQNTGTCTWSPTYSFVYVSGDQMNGKNINLASYVAPGQTVDLTVKLTAPVAQGTYRGNWQMRSPQGSNFGQTIWVKIRVPGNNLQPTARPSDGQTRTIPVISEFYPNYYSGTQGTCPVVYWRTKNASAIDIYVDGAFISRSQNASGSTQVCGAILNTGSHTVSATAHSVTDDSYASFTYTTNGSGDDGQKRVIPSFDYFYVSPDSGDVGDSTTLYWSASNAGSIDLFVDGTQIERTYNSTGSSWIYSELQGVGTHTISATAHSVTDDAYATAYFTTNEGQRQIIPSVDYFYVSPDSGYSGEGTTIYWSCSNTSSVDIYVDGSTVVSNGGASGSKSISSEVQSIGNHVIAITAHSVTDDSYDATSYNTMEHATGFGTSSSDDDQGGWAGSNYYDDSSYDQGGWAGSNYYDDTAFEVGDLIDD